MEFIIPHQDFLKTEFKQAVIQYYQKHPEDIVFKSVGSDTMKGGRFGLLKSQGINDLFDILAETPVTELDISYNSISSFEIAEIEALMNGLNRQGIKKLNIAFQWIFNLEN
ncbi:hypothetical protein FOG18_09895 [Legionella israelensis]|uniref:hypothetical protein n=1 Tax=Legionella israelensis TaxID=454 RepID=UPI00117F2963|nr:hypothetical protein [Legionella israelensis]QDP72849.1 hypothetical protein FOG18_09895 [Legionella israelensis]